MISKANVNLPITGIRHPPFFFFLLSCLTRSTWSFSELKDRKKSDLLSVIPHSKWVRGSISLSFPQGKADTKSSMDGNRWAWLPSWSCVVSLCLPEEACLIRVGLCWHQAVPHLYLTSTCVEGGGNLMACEVLWSSRSFLAAVMFPCFPPPKLRAHCLSSHSPALAENWY